MVSLRSGENAKHFDFVHFPGAPSTLTIIQLYMLVCIDIGDLPNNHELMYYSLGASMVREACKRPKPILYNGSRQNKRHVLWRFTLTPILSCHTGFIKIMGLFVISICRAWFELQIASIAIVAHESWIMDEFRFLYQTLEKISLWTKEDEISHESDFFHNSLSRVWIDKHSRE